MRGTASTMSTAVMMTRVMRTMGGSLGRPREHLGRRRRLIPVSALSLRPQLKTSNVFLESLTGKGASWSFLASHARVLPCFARDPGVRLRDTAAGLGITERGACGIDTGLTAAGYVVKQEDGRRSRYQIQAYLLLPGPGQAGTRHRRHPGPSSRAPARDCS
jgi:hypothetical protein